MRKAISTLACVVLAYCATGCHTRTNVVRTVQHKDGTLETYTNYSDGYNYNPNWTGHSDMNSSNRVNTHNTQDISTQLSGFGVPLSSTGQYTIR